MNYWVIYNGSKLGPLSLDQVRSMHLDPSTPIWYSGLADWTTAAQVPALADTLMVPFTPYVQPEHHEPMPNTYLGWSIAATLLCCLIPGVVAIFYSAKVEPAWQRGDYEAARRASDWAQLWIIAAVVLGIVSIPLQIVIAAL